jgi:hypothetical protein
MPALVAGIDVCPLSTLPRQRGRVERGKQGVDGRDRTGYDGAEIV